jgi:hypothetical protein
MAGTLVGKVAIVTGAARGPSSWSTEALPLFDLEDLKEAKTLLDELA